MNTICICQSTIWYCKKYPTSKYKPLLDITARETNKKTVRTVQKYHRGRGVIQFISIITLKNFTLNKEYEISFLPIHKYSNYHFLKYESNQMFRFSDKCRDTWIIIIEQKEQTTDYHTLITNCEGLDLIDIYYVYLHVMGVIYYQYQCKSLHLSIYWNTRDVFLKCSCRFSTIAWL